MNLLRQYPNMFTWLFRLCVANFVLLPTLSLWIVMPATAWGLYVLAFFGILFLWRR